MFHVITAANRDRFEPQIREMHEWRARIFVAEQGWDLPIADGLEIDAFDDDRTLYFLDYDEGGRLVSGQRMRPAGDKSLTGDLFAPAVAAPDPSLYTDRTWEMSRGFVLPEHRGPGRQRRRAAMRLAILEAGLAAGCDRFLAFTDLRLLPYFLNSAYRFRPLGLPLATADGDGIAIEIEVSEGSVAHMRERLGLLEPAMLSTAPRGAGPVAAADFGRAIRRLLAPLREAPGARP